MSKVIPIRALDQKKIQHNAHALAHIKIKKKLLITTKNDIPSNISSGISSKARILRRALNPPGSFRWHANKSPLLMRLPTLPRFVTDHLAKPDCFFTPNPHHQSLLLIRPLITCRAEINDACSRKKKNFSPLSHPPLKPCQSQRGEAYLEGGKQKRTNEKNKINKKFHGWLVMPVARACGAGEEKKKEEEEEEERHFERLLHLLGVEGALFVFFFFFFLSFWGLLLAILCSLKSRLSYLIFSYIMSTCLPFEQSKRGSSKHTPQSIPQLFFCFLATQPLASFFCFSYSFSPEQITTKRTHQFFILGL